MKIQYEETKQLNLFSHAEWWTDFEIAVFVEEYLHANLSMLDSKKLSHLTQCEVMDWVFSDEDVGLSFILCCRVLEFDYQELRQLIKQRQFN